MREEYLAEEMNERDDLFEDIPKSLNLLSTSGRSGKRGKRAAQLVRKSRYVGGKICP